MTTLAQTQAIPSTWSGALLVAGTCIGAGMLALPIQTATAGFSLSFLILTLSWIFMCFTGLLLVEATLWLKNQAHFSTLSLALLGPWGKSLSLVVYLFMNIASLVAYTSGGATLFSQWFGISYTSSCLVFTALFGSIVCLGALFIGRINAILTALMIAFYICLVGTGLPNIHTDYLHFRPEWLAGFHSLPLILTAFSYQMVVPSLCSYLHYDLKKLKRSIVIGTLIPFAVYTLWLLVIHGLVPLEEFATQSITDPLKAHIGHFALRILTDGFAFFALVTSYLGLSLALFDFIRDLFKDRLPSKATIAFLSLVPALFFAILFPNALLSCLDLSGGFGDTLLSGLIPVAMIWVGRYRSNLTSEYTTPGGKTALLLAGAFAFSIFIFQWIKLF